MVDRIGATWGIHAKVIYPPVEVTAIQAVSDWRTRLSSDELRILGSLPGQFVLGASRFISYKRLDLVIEAGEAAQIPVVLAGGGPDAALLRQKATDARVPVYIVDDASTALLYALYQAASVFVFPPVEDFGIMPIEAMAVGTPAVGSPIGGSSETITDGISGAHFESDSPVDVARAINQALELDHDTVRAASSSFSRERFDANFSGWMTESLKR